MKKTILCAFLAVLAGQFTYAQDKTLYIENGEFEGAWPFSVDSAAITCGKDKSLFIISYGDDDGVDALNDSAKNNLGFYTDASVKAQADISPIWQKDSQTGEFVALTDVINFGLENMCE